MQGPAIQDDMVKYEHIGRDDPQQSGETDKSCSSLTTLCLGVLSHDMMDCKAFFEDFADASKGDKFLDNNFNCRACKKPVAAHEHRYDGKTQLSANSDHTHHFFVTCQQG